MLLMVYFCTGSPITVKTRGINDNISDNTRKWGRELKMLNWWVKKLQNHDFDPVVPISGGVQILN